MSNRNADETTARLGRPPTRGITVELSARITPEAKDKLRRIAEAKDTSMSIVVQGLIEKARE